MIDIDLTRRPDESAFEYHKRLVYGKLVDKSLSDVDYAELSELAYGKEYSSEVARKLFYGSKLTLDLIDEEQLSSVTDSDILDEITTKKRDLQKERVKLQTEKLEYSRWLREDARDELFEQKVIEAIRDTLPKSNPPRDIPVVHGPREGVLCIADMHFGKEYKIYGISDEVINEYSPEICFDRMEQIYNETLDTVEREGLTEIRVYNLGDSVDGFLRHSQIWTLRYGVIDSAILFGNYMGDWLKKLSEHVNVVYGQTDGNHDELRLIDGRKGQHTNESAGKIILNCIRLKNENNPNFRIIENKTGFIFDTVCGYNILGIHGECKNMAAAIKDYSNVYGADISYLVGGHKHHAEYQNCGVRKGTIGIGSIVGSDDFSMKLARCADATSSFLVFENGKGKVREYTYVLS